MAKQMAEADPADSIAMNPDLASELAAAKDATGMDPDRIQRALARQVRSMRMDAAAAGAKRLGAKL